jgi:hypothetical protein
MEIKFSVLILPEYTINVILNFWCNGISLCCPIFRYFVILFLFRRDCDLLYRCLYFATSGAGTVNTPGTLEFTAFSMVRVAQFLVCYAVLCRQLFVFLSLFILQLCYICNLYFSIIRRYSKYNLI